MKHSEMEEGTAGMLAGSDNDDKVKVSSSSMTVQHWARAWMCYMGILDAFLSVSVYLSMMPQYVSLPAIASEHESIAAALVQLVGYPLLMTIVAGKAQIILMLVAEILQHERPNYILEVCTGIFMTLFNFSEESRRKVESFLKISFGLSILGGIAYGIYLEYQGQNFGVISGFLVVCCHMTTIYVYFHYLGMIANICRSEYLNLEYQALPQLHDKPIIHHFTASAMMTRHDMMMGKGLMLGVFIAQVIVGLLVWFRIIGSMFLILSTALGAIFYALAFSYFFPSMVRRRSYLFPCTSCFWIVIGLLAFFAIVFSLVPSLGEQDVAGGDHRLSMPLFQPGQRFNATYVGPGELSGYGAYPVCSAMSWITRNIDGKEFQILDLLVFAKAIYYSTHEDIMAEIGNATYNTELWPVKLRLIQDVHQSARIGVFDLPGTKTRVAVLRGTSQGIDWLFNADVWAPSVLLSLVKYVMPFGSLFPLSWTSFVLAPDIREILGLPPPWEEVREKILKIHEQSMEDGYSLILTGHSLGGGIAQLIGSVEGIRTVTFSPVGQAVTQSRVTGALRQRDLPIANTAVSVLPAGDIVPKIDEQLGVTQRIACTAFNPVTCHSLVQTACELYRKCGDNRNRSIEATCNQQVGEDWKTIPWQRFVWYD